MQNAKLKLILIAILIIAIVISALFLYPWLEQRKEKERQLALVKEDFQRCRNFENITMIDINPENPSVDITGMDTTIEYIIYAGKSLDCLTLHDIYFCNFITNEEEKRLCEEAYYSIKALKENNLDYCEKAGERKLLCQAILKKDETLCQEGEKQAGTSPFSKFEACKAAIKEDGEECESFQSEIKTQQCKIDYYIISALIKNDKNFCDKIENKRKAWIHCKAILDVNECLKYHSEVQCPEIYLRHIAQLTGDPSICESIPYKEADDRGRFIYQVCLKDAE